MQRLRIPIALALLAVLAACGGDGGAVASQSTADADRAAADGETEAASTAASTAGSEPVTIRFESYNYGNADLGGEGIQQLLDSFAAQHPDIVVEPSGTPAGEIHTSIAVQAAAGNPPDVAQISLSKFPFVLEELPYVPVEDVAPPDEWEEHIAGIVPQALAVGQDDGTVVGLPFVISTPTLFINADLFAEAGLDPSDPPATWEEAREAALAIVETGAQGIYVNAANEPKSDFITQSLVNSNGGSVLSPEGEVTFDSPEAIEALAMLGELTASGAQPPVTESEATGLFQAGELGMYLTSTAVFGSLREAAEGQFDIATGGMPAFGDQPVGPTNSGGGLFVFAQDPAKQQAAWELVRFLTSAEGYTVVTEVIGYLPLRPDIVDDPAYLGPYFDRDPRLLPSMEQLDNLVPYQVFPGPNGTQAREILQDDAVAPIMFSGADAETVLTEAAARVRELLR